MITIYEGPDCVGKTTMAMKSAGSEGTYIHWGNHMCEPKIAHDVLFGRILAMRDCQIHCDRSPIGEYIYSKYRGGDCRFSRGDVGWVVHQPGVQIIFVTADLWVAKRMAELSKQPGFVLDNYEAIHRDYNHLCAELRREKNVHYLNNSMNILGHLAQVDSDYVYRMCGNDYNLRLRDISDNAAALTTEASGDGSEDR